ncbi:MAG: AAA family ATPase [Limnobacter sp.]|nr:AAA family ATPase [Limnobacter sp.]
MQQLLLDVFTPPKPTLVNFLVGDNAQVINALDALAQHHQGAQAGSPDFPVIYLYGSPGCGKSHLLRAIANQLDTRVLPGNSRFVFRPEQGCLIIDDVAQLTPYSQVQVFNAFNSHVAGTAPGIIVLADALPPQALPVREDLKTRILAGLCLRVQPLSDHEKTAALNQMATERGLQLSEEVLDYALKNFRRDMGSLIAVLDGLDRFSLEQQKPVSLYLLRHWMRRRESLLVKHHKSHTP